MTEELTYICYCRKCGAGKLIPMPIKRTIPGAEPFKIERLYCPECQAIFSIDDIAWKRW